MSSLSARAKERLWYRGHVGFVETQHHSQYRELEILRQETVLNWPVTPVVSSEE